MNSRLARQLNTYVAPAWPEPPGGLWAPLRIWAGNAGAMSAHPPRALAEGIHATSAAHERATARASEPELARALVSW